MQVRVRDRLSGSSSIVQANVDTVKRMLMFEQAVKLDGEVENRRPLFMCESEEVGLVTAWDYEGMPQSEWKSIRNGDR